MQALVLGLAVATFASTMVGGLAALRLRGVLHYFFAFAAGSLLGVAFFDILPESIDLAGGNGLPTRWVFVTLVGAFFVYSLVERFLLTHHEHGEEPGDHGHIMGPIGAGSLVLHSFFDGAAIGAAFQVGQAAGLIVALAVIFHDFTDGINTVTLMMRNRQEHRRTQLFLLADALAPVAGVLVTLVIAIHASVLPLLLAFFAGEFLYIGAANLLPETYKHGHQLRMLALMAAGAGLILVLTSVA